MADPNMKNFSKRVHRINKRHRRLGDGAVTTITHDGLIVSRVSRRAPRFPWKGVALCFIAFFAFKGLLLVQLGETAFNDRVNQLQSGTVVEQAGAFAMSADPITKLIAAKIQKILP